MNNVPLSWGKCTLFIKNLGTQNAKWVKLCTPAEGSTNLASNQGDKMEAKIEGGENEAVKYKKNTYQLTYNIRKAQGRAQPIANTDGVVSDEYAVLLQPEDATTDGFYIERTSANVQDTFTTDEGAIWQITHDALSPSTVGTNTVKWGTVTTTATEVSFTENEEMMAKGQSTPVAVAASAFEEQD